MNKILIYEPDVRLNDLYQSVVDSSVYNFEVIPFYEPDELIEYMETESSGVVLTLVDYNSSEITGIDLSKKIKAKGLEVSSILMCDEEPKKFELDEFLDVQTDNEVFYKTRSAKDLRETIREVLKKITHISGESFDEYDYSPISPMVLLYSEDLPADVYFKKNDDEYALLFPKEKKITPEDIQQFIEKGINKFHIISSVRAEFYDHFLNILGNKKYKKSPKLEGSNLAIQQQVLGMVFDRLKEVGADEKMVGLAKRNIEANLDMINSAKGLKKLLAKVVGKGELGFEHSMGTNFVSQMILKQIEWRSSDTQYKLSLAAFFHDLFIPEFDEGMEKLEGLDEYDSKKIKMNSPEFYNHPAKAAEFVDNLKDIPPDTAQIIATHHELPKGKGFPKQLFGSRTSSLGCVFNTSHYFCLQLYKNGWNKEGIEISLTDMRKSFKDGNYEKPFEALCAIFEN